MHSIISGTLLLGFTKLVKCARCNNLTEFQIQQGYVKQELLGIPISTQYCGVTRMCPVCEHGEWLIQRNLFVSEAAEKQVRDLLEGGREKTKSYVLQLSDQERKVVFRRLNKLKAFSLVQYIAS